jgi:2-polyprenyl-3-methyl-5-hydroxy-6-metoxy-1,4-benzoquinol methylase
LTAGPDQGYSLPCQDVTDAAPPQHVLGLFRDAPLPARVHVQVRWRLFPFPSLLPFAPAAGTAVDLGCGHGLFPFCLATERPGLQVLGVDPDSAKIALARGIAERHGLSRLSFAAGLAEEAALPPCDLVSLIDVLYLVPYEAQERLLRTAAACLRPGGRLLVKEMRERPRWKAGWNRAQELIAVRLLHLSHGRRFYFRPQAEWQALLGGLGLAVQTSPLDEGYLHPHVLFVAARPATGSASAPSRSTSGAG